MAKRRSVPKTVDTSSGKTQRFDKELTDDIRDYHLGESQWTHARNAITNSSTGDFGDIGNEPSNKFCAQAPYTVIGTIHIYSDVWMIFSTDDSNSEIGLFDESKCEYFTVANAPCLNFKRTNLIIGASKENYDCKWTVYWSDALNPDRVLTVDIENFAVNLPFNPDGSNNPNTDVPWVQNCVDDNGNAVGGCIICTNTNVLDCDKLRLESLVKPPCFRVEKGRAAGTIRNGSYYVVGAYMIDGVRINDYSLPSNVQPIFVHENLGASLEIFVEYADTRFDEYELVLVSFFNEQTTARRVGVYSTRQQQITLDFIDDRWIAVSLDNIPLRTTISDKSDGIFRNGNYLLRVGPTSKFDFNYQPLANQIRAKWQCVEYNEGYYYEGGNNAGYLRDEVYSFFIRWVYDTGDKSASYHIPGRPQFTLPTWQSPNGNVPTLENALAGADNLPEIAEGITPFNWIVYNTATLTGQPNTPLADGGSLIAEGYMGYWESTEFYDDNNPIVWNAGVGVGAYPNTNPTDYDLCGKPIRHHKFPENIINGLDVTNHYKCSNLGGEGCKIRIMGVKFENVLPPVDNDGNPIPGIVGYEILRGSRLGNASILAKGMINNTFEYNLNAGPGNSNVNIISNRTGLYPNYPYNDLRPDPYISQTEVTWEPITGALNNSGSGSNLSGGGGGGYYGYTANNRVNKKIFTFHSPDTQFTDPFLSTDELKIYGELNGRASGNFTFPDKHPKHKFVTDAAFIAGILAGIAYAMVAMNGKRRLSKRSSRLLHLGGDIITGTGAAGGQIPGLLTGPAALTTQGIQNGLISAAITGNNAADLIDALIGSNTAESTFNSAAQTGDSSGAFLGSSSDFERDLDGAGGLPGVLRVISSGILFYNYMVEGIDTTLDIIRTFSKFRQHALQYQSHCKYGGWQNNVLNNRRRVITNARYTDPYFQDFGANYRINNLIRNRMVAVEVTTNVQNPVTTDNTKFNLKSITPNGLYQNYKNPGRSRFTTASSHYVALKQRARNQYGQIDSIVQVPVSTCTTKIDTVTTTLFNGDTYVGRHTEKCTMPFFYDWLYQQVDGTEYDYKIHQMIPFVRFWMNTEKFEFADFIQSISTAFGNLTGSSLNISSFFSSLVTPSDMHCFDRAQNVAGIINGLFVLRDMYIYLFNSGVRDFFVESNVNVDLRDWGEADNQRHYHPYTPYTDLKSLFDMGIIRSDNFFKYDSNLSISKLFNNYISWGRPQPRSYNPYDAETCYIYRPKRVIYSLPQNTSELKVDNWRIFLPLNYRDFISKIITIKPIFTSGAMILFENESPILFKGVEELTTTSNTKITIGDGGLFNQPLQNMSNSDRPYEYGSCQNRLSCVNTPYGAFYMSQNQGKIFAVAGEGLSELTIPGGLKWWFSTFLPYQLTEQFPDFQLIDNPVIGIGCQSIYDNTNGLIYFCKKDYSLKPGVNAAYKDGNQFIINGLLTIGLGDPDDRWKTYFDDASWTVSYDLKTKVWVGWHDWHPDLVMGGKTNFMTISKDGSIVDPATGVTIPKTNGIWIHNEVCDSYCNYYGKDYPFEIEFPINTIQTVNTLRSVEYQMEAYNYENNCYDRFHLLDFNFDEAVVYNSEQCSGLLKLNISPKNNPTAMIQYPIINPTSIDILYSKVEQKYRFNQFWDVTNDRGEYTNVEEVIWNTQPNGYVQILNAANLNYNKYQTQRKKFRHYENYVFLRRVVSGKTKMLVMITNGKNLYSPR
jgi:hypothetical protein